MSRESSKRIARHWPIVSAALVGILAILCAARVNAGTIVVDSTDDDTALGHCTLREAINEALARGERGSCEESGLGVSTIIFNTNLAGQTITLGSSLPTIVTYDVTIVGPTTTSTGMTISGNNANRIIENRARLSLQYLTLSNGKSEMKAGAIYNEGLLTITNCTFSSNRTIAVGRLAIAQGGAIFNNTKARLTISNSTFVGNRVDTNGQTIDAIAAIIAGGAIYTATDVALSITNSTFTGNAVIFIGVAGKMTLNLVEGGAVDSNGVLSIVNTTFSGNSVSTNVGSSSGGAVKIGSTASKIVSGTILAGNKPGNCDGFFTANYDLSDDASCRFSGTSRDNVTDIDLDTGLKNNGGPTQTIALTSAMSAAVDLIPPQDCPKTDQRGFVRPATGQARCDAGAFELGATP